MSGLTTEDREAICVCAELSCLLAHDAVKAACVARESVVEAIIARHVKAALTEAAELIDDEHLTDATGEPDDNAYDDAIDLAVSIVRDLADDH